MPRSKSKWIKKFTNFFGREDNKHKYDKKKINEVMDSYDRIFKTLITPVTFIIVLTWSFYFFAGSIFAIKNPDYIETQIYNFYIPLIASQVIFVIISVLTWILSVFARVRETEKLFKWELKNQSVARFLKRISLAPMIIALMFSPAPIIVLAIQRTIGQDLASQIYMIAVIIVIYLIMLFLPERTIIRNERR